MQGEAPGGLAAFALIYFTFFLDNVMLTLIVPLAPDWVADEPTQLELPATPSNHTLTGFQQALAEWSSGAVEDSEAVVGLVLGAKAGAQLVTAPLAGAAVCRRGAARVLRVATAALTAAAMGLGACGTARGSAAAWCVGTARAVQGCGAALGGVAGLALAGAALSPAHTHRGLGALLGAVALGVLVGYPLGGVAAELETRVEPFLLLALLLALDLALQYKLLNREEYNRPPAGTGRAGAWSQGVRDVVRAARVGAVGACAGCVALTTSVVAALEAAAPAWLARRFHAARWQAGAVFVADSAAYLAGASAAGPARRIGAERVALAAQLTVALAAAALPAARSVGALAGPHALLGLGLGAADAALVPALVARGGRLAARRAALLHAAGAAAYALAPPLAAALVSATSFELTLRVLAALNLLYAAFLYTSLRAYPISEQWGAQSTLDSDDEDDSERASTEGTPLAGLTHLTHSTAQGVPMPH